MIAAEATGDPVLGRVILALLALVWLAGYLIACWIWPFAACSKCKGARVYRSPSGKAWRKCRRCKGSGERIRTGRRVWNWLSRAHRDAQ